MTPDRRAIIVVDLAYGDCGKGTIVDFLTRRCDAQTVVRFNGGPQAGHNVVTRDGRHHTFSQFGSGSFVPGVKTVLSRFVLIEPYAMLNEARHLAEVGIHEAMERLTIDQRCTVITPCHQAANRIRELARGGAAHGTCGMGVGETMHDAIEHPGLTLHAERLSDATNVGKTLRALQEIKRDELRETIRDITNHPRAADSINVLTDDAWIEIAVDVYREVAARTTIADETKISEIVKTGTVIYEGAHGVLLDELFGFHPHTTWSNTTCSNARTFMREMNIDSPCTRIGVLRSYLTRHGPGPFVTEDSSLRDLHEPHNDDVGWQGRFRVGIFDAVAARYALAAAGPIDALALTHLDRLTSLPPKICDAYKQPEIGTTREISVIPPGDLVARESLTSRLLHSVPLFDTIETTSVPHFVRRLEEFLPARVGITSHGPTADEKEVFDSVLRF